jgi:hypothetical protein
MMNVTFQRSALDDIKNEKGGVPKQFRKPLRDFLRNMTYIGQGMRCSDPRYPDLYFIKFRNWYVLYLPLSQQQVVVVAVMYNYGQLP